MTNQEKIDYMSVLKDVIKFAINNFKNYGKGSLGNFDYTKTTNSENYDSYINGSRDVEIRISLNPAGQYFVKLYRRSNQKLILESWDYTLYLALSEMFLKIQDA